MIDCGWIVGRGLPVSEQEQEQGRDHAAHPQRETHGGGSFDPIPSPPIGFQVFHDILRRLCLSSMTLPSSSRGSIELQ
jgi:hypothetical protein